MRRLKFALSVIITILIASCTPKILKLKTTQSDFVISKNSKILIPNGSLYNFVEIKKSKIKYNVCVNKKNEIIYISTSDPEFKIKGLNVNNLLSDISKKGNIEYIEGWGYYIKINSEWYAAFDLKSSPTTSSKIQWFFKYKFSKGNKKLFDE